jgi:preprotein translocase subunit YajC
VLLAAQSSGSSSFSLLLMMVLIFGAMYFLMIRPQQRRRREVESMQASIGIGDEVVTVGGLYGTVADIDDETVTLEVAPGIENRYARAAIGRVISSAERAADEEAEDEADAVVDTKD